MTNRTIQCILENQEVIMETLVTLLNRTRPRMTVSNPRVLVERIADTNALLSLLRTRSGSTEGCGG